MKKLAITILFAICLPIAIYAQSKITVGTPHTNYSTYYKYYFNEGNEALSVKFVDDKVIIQKFNSSTLAETGSTTYTDFEKGFIGVDALKLGNKFYFFYTCFSKEKKTDQLLSREIDFKTGKFIDKGQAIITPNGRPFPGTREAAAAPTYMKYLTYELITTDHNNVLVETKIYNGEPTEKVGLYIFDSNMKNLLTKETTLPYNYKSITIADYALDASGNAYLTIGPSPKSKHNLLELFKFSAKGDTKIQIPTDLPINQLHLVSGLNKELIYAGFYGDEPEELDGIVVFRLDENLRIKSKTSVEIPTEIRSFYKEKPEQLENYSIQSIEPNADGSFVLIAEERYTMDHFNYKDILIAKFSSDNKLVWMKRLPKNQVGTGMFTVMSYKYVREGNKHTFIFLDHPGNSPTYINERSKAIPSDNGNISAYTVDDAKGDVNKYNILRTSDVNKLSLSYTNPNQFMVLGNKTFAFEAYKEKKEDILIKFTVE